MEKTHETKHGNWKENEMQQNHKKISDTSTLLFVFPRIWEEIFLWIITTISIWTIDPDDIQKKNQHECSINCISLLFNIRQSRAKTKKKQTTYHRCLVTILNPVVPIMNLWNVAATNWLQWSVCFYHCCENLTEKKDEHVKKNFLQKIRYEIW